MKRQFVIKLREIMKAQSVGVNFFQKMLKTGSSQVQHLLDSEDVGISLKSIAKILCTLGAVEQISMEKKSSKKRVA